MPYALKGEYSSLGTYAPGDLVLGSDGVVYVCIAATTAGIHFMNTNYFTKANGEVQALAPALMGLAYTAADLEGRVAALELAAESEDDPPASDETT